MTRSPHRTDEPAGPNLANLDHGEGLVEAHHEDWKSHPERMYRRRVREKESGLEGEAARAAQPRAPVAARLGDAAQKDVTWGVAATTSRMSGR